MKPITKVAIVGGGIGGLTAAIALKKIKIKPYVFEGAKEWKENVGSGIGLWRNSLNCYKKLGLYDNLLSHGSLMKNPSYRDSQGRILAKPTSNFDKEFPVLCLHRSDLQKTLLSPLRSEKDMLNPNSQFVRYEQKDDGVTLYFSDGRSITVDLLIGADGIHSPIRKQMFQGKQGDYEPKYMGYTYYRATLSLSDSDYDKYRDSFESWGEGKRFGYVPLKKPQVFWFTSFPTEELKDRRYREPNIKENLLKLYSHWHSPIGDLIKNTEESHIFRTDIFQVPKLDTWSDGKVVLLGDSCHATAPNLAQGAGLAIEDSLELAKCLKDYNEGKFTTIEEAIKMYEKNRMTRAHVVQTIAGWIAHAGQIQNSTLFGTRDLLMRSVPDPLRAYVFEKAVRFSLGWNYSVPEL